MSRILCFGDSITWGAWDLEGGWVARLRKLVDTACIESDLKTFCLTYNLGVSSDTSERLLARFDSEAAARALEVGDSAFIFSIGTNDSIWRIHEHKHWVELPDFKRNIADIIQMAKRYSPDVVFLGNLPVDESKTRPYRSDPAISSKNADIEEYDQAVQEICKASGTPFVPVFDEAKKGDYKSLLFTDGIHPNNAGHEFLAGKVWRQVQALGWVNH